MLNKEKIYQILETVMKHTQADETEILIQGVKHALTRFANNAIHQNVSDEGMNISVRTSFGNRTGRANTNKCDKTSIKKLVETSMAITKLSDENDNLLPMLGKQEYKKINNYYNATADFGALDRAKAIGNAIKLAKDTDFSAAGIFANKENFTLLANSNGLFALDRFTSAAFSATITGTDSTGYINISSSDIETLDIRHNAQIAINKTLKSAEPKTIAPGKYTVILEPQAVADLMMFIIFGGFVSAFSGQAAEIEQRSYLTGKLGKKIFGDNITIIDDVYHSLQSGLTYDFEGVPRQRLILIENGAVKNFTYDRANAKKLGKEPTGHGLPLPNAFGSAPMNVVVQGGTTSIKEMIKSTDKGILITRFWYNREVDFINVIVTGMTRDGTFYVEDGKIQYGIKNMRFNQSLVEMLNNVTALSEPERKSDEDNSIIWVVPAMKINNFHFSSV